MTEVMHAAADLHDLHDLILDCLTTASPLAFDEVALARTVTAALAEGERSAVVVALAELALVVSRRSRDAARVLYAAIERGVRAAEVRDAATRAGADTRRAPMLGSHAPAGSIKLAQLLGGRRRP